MDTGIIALLLWVVTIVGYVFRNLWIQNKKLEKIVEEQQQFINENKASINQITEIFDKVDQENIFRSNDYVGQMWIELKQLNEVLKNYK